MAGITPGLQLSQAKQGKETAGDDYLTDSIAGSLLALGALFGSLSAVYLMDAVGRKASLLAFSVMSLFIGEFSSHVNFTWIYIVC
jgi:hypothetical protein